MNPKPLDPKTLLLMEKLKRFESWQYYPKTGYSVEKFAEQIGLIVAPVAAQNKETADGIVTYPAISLEDAAEWLCSEVAARFEFFPRPIQWRRIWHDEGYVTADRRRLDEFE